MIVVPISLREANDFVSNFHRHNGRTSRDGGKFAIGASNGNQMFGVAIVGRPIARLLARDHATGEVLRCCVTDDAPKGTCSFLYARCWRAWQAMGGRKLITYTLETETGASLRGAGWRVVGRVKPGGWNRMRTAFFTGAQSSPMLTNPKQIRHSPVWRSYASNQGDTSWRTGLRHDYANGDDLQTRQAMARRGSAHGDLQKRDIRAQA